jgi:signal peptidase I
MTNLGMKKFAATAVAITCVSTFAAPPSRADNITDATIACLQNQDLDLQIKGCTALIEILPAGEGLAFPLTKRGNAYADRKDFNKAIDDYTRVIAIAPSQKDGYLNRGIAYMQLQAADKALADFQKVVEIEPNFAEGYYQRGIAHDALSASESAIADLERAVALDPNEKRYTNALATIRTLNLVPALAGPVQARPPDTGETPRLIVPGVDEPRTDVAAPGAQPSKPTVETPTVSPPALTAQSAAPPSSSSGPPPGAAPGLPKGRFVIGSSSPIPGFLSLQMLPTLRPGDEVEITPYTGSPKPGDIVALKLPSDSNSIIARRLIGLPGDEVLLRAGVVFLNGMEVARTHVKTVGGTAAYYRETLPNGTQYEVLERRPGGSFDDAGPFKVPAGHYFVLGDNRESVDSRSRSGLGYVPAANIVGQVQKAGAPVPPSSMEPSPVAAQPGPLPDMAVGAAGAPVTVVEYSSMACSHCANFVRDVLPGFKSAYVDTGKVRFVFREFPLGDAATRAAMLVRCAEPGKQLPIMEKLFAAQSTWLVADALPPLRALASEAGLSEAADKCLADQSLFDKLTAARTQATEALGIKSVPTFFVNGRRLEGESAIKELSGAVETALSGSARTAAAPTQQTAAPPSAPAPASPVANTACAPGVHVSVSATILDRDPPRVQGDPWTLGLRDWQRGGCDLAAIQTDAEPPAACAEDAKVTASGTVFDQTLQNPGDLRCGADAEAHGSSGWFSWLWGSKKPTTEPSPPVSSATVPAPVMPAAQSPPVSNQAAASAPAAPAASPSAQPAASPDQLVDIPTGCPIGQDFGGWTIRRGSLQGAPVVTTGSSETHEGTSTKWKTDDISLEIMPRKDGKWLAVLFVKNLKHADTPVHEITGPYAVVVWNAATHKSLGGVESDAGGNNVYREPHTIIGLASWNLEESIDRIEATPEIDIALALPKEDGSGLINIAWIRPYQSHGLRAALAAAKPCAVQ